MWEYGEPETERGSASDEPHRQIGWNEKVSKRKRKDKVERSAGFAN